MAYFRIACLFVLFLPLTVAAAEDTAMFPFLISYEGANNVTSMSHLLQAPAGKDGFIRVENGRFVNDAGPIRLHATNLTGPANFPTHEQADKLADRLARLGINCVRLHYFDAAYGNFMTKALPGIIADDPKTQKKLDPNQRDRQDYLIAALKKRGIYVNMNLHVARTLDKRDGFTGPKPGMDKGLAHFEPEMIELQKEYAKELLGHVNPYTKLRYTEDPCIAVVEINNESSLFHFYRGGFNSLADRYKSELRKQWNRWLKQKYTSTEALKITWKLKTEPLRDEQITDGAFKQPIVFDGKIWILSKSDAAATAQAENGVLKINVTKAGSEYFPKLFRTVRVKKDEVYTLKFRIRRTDSEKTAELGLAVADTVSGWRSLGLLQRFRVGKDWQTLELPFESVEDSDSGQIQITRFPVGTYEIAALSFQTGAARSISQDGSLEKETIPLVPANGYAAKQARTDFATFLLETDSNYWVGINRYLKEKLGLRSVVSGTQLGYCPPQIQAKLDYVDEHAYWCHPSPVNKDWRIRNVSMVDSFSCIIGMANQRVYGKPYTISEYNHPFPNFYGAEGQPMLRAYGAFQGWDGVFEYTYNHSPDFEPLRNTYFFSIIARTDVLAHFPACAAMYLRGDVREAQKSIVAAFDEDNFMKRFVAATDTGYSIGSSGFDSKLAMIHKTGIALDGQNATDTKSVEKIDAKVLVSDTGELLWNKENPSAAYWTVNTANTKLFSGFPEDRTISLGNVSLKVGKTKLNWATISLVSRFATGFGEKGKANILLAATGCCENENMKVVKTGQSHITLTDWGNGTVLAEGIPAIITLPAAPDKVRCYALDPKGNRQQEVPVTKTADGKSGIAVEPKYRTVWYEIEIQDSNNQ